MTKLLVVLALCAALCSCGCSTQSTSTYQVCGPGQHLFTDTTTGAQYCFLNTPPPGIDA